MEYKYFKISKEFSELYDFVLEVTKLNSSDYKFKTFVADTLFCNKSYSETHIKKLLVKWIDNSEFIPVSVFFKIISEYLQTDSQKFLFQLDKNRINPDTIANIQPKLAEKARNTYNINYSVSILSEVELFALLLFHACDPDPFSCISTLPISNRFFEPNYLFSYISKTLKQDSKIVNFYAQKNSGKTNLISKYISSVTNLGTIAYTDYKKTNLQQFPYCDTIIFWKNVIEATETISTEHANLILKILSDYYKCNNSVSPYTIQIIDNIPEKTAREILNNWDSSTKLVILTNRPLFSNSVPLIPDHLKNKYINDYLNSRSLNNTIAPYFFRVYYGLDLYIHNLLVTQYKHLQKKENESFANNYIIQLSRDFNAVKNIPVPQNRTTKGISSHISAYIEQNTIGLKPSSLTILSKLTPNTVFTLENATFWFNISAQNIEQLFELGLCQVVNDNVIFCFPPLISTIYDNMDSIDDADFKYYLDCIKNIQHSILQIDNQFFYRETMTQVLYCLLDKLSFLYEHTTKNKKNHKKYIKMLHNFGLISVWFLCCHDYSAKPAQLYKMISFKYTSASPAISMYLERFYNYIDHGELITAETDYFLRLDEVTDKIIISPAHYTETEVHILIQNYITSMDSITFSWILAHYTGSTTNEIQLKNHYTTIHSKFVFLLDALKENSNNNFRSYTQQLRDYYHDLSHLICEDKREVYWEFVNKKIEYSHKAIHLKGKLLQLHLNTSLANINTPDAVTSILELNTIQKTVQPLSIYDEQFYLLTLFLITNHSPLLHQSELACIYRKKLLEYIAVNNIEITSYLMRNNSFSSLTKNFDISIYPLKS